MCISLPEAPPGLASPNSEHKGLRHLKTASLIAELRMTLALGTRRNNRISPLGGSSVHAGQPSSGPRETQLPNSRLFTTLFPQVASGAAGEGIAREPQTWGLSEKAPGPVSQGRSFGHAKSFHRLPSLSGLPSSPAQSHPISPF